MSDTKEPAHSPLGPSSAERWIHCGGSVRATEGLPDTDSEFSIEGTAAHTLSEMARIENVPAQKFLGTMIPVARVDGTTTYVEANQEMVDGVQEFIDMCELFPGDAYFEVRVRYDQWVPGAYGTADDIRIDNEVCNVTDLKFGKGIKVQAKDNEQLKMYALGVLHDYGYLYELKEFNIHIAQPRIGNFDSFSITTPELLEWADTVVRPASKLAMSDNAPFKAGEWCQWCKIKATCRVRAEFIAQHVLSEFEDLTLADVKTAKDVKKLVAKPIALMTNDEVGLIFHAVDMIKGWCKDVQNYVMSQLQQGHAVLDWKLVAGRSNRAWAGDPADVEKALSKAGVTDEQMFKKKMNGPAKIEKIIGKKHPLMKAPDPDDPKKGGIVSKPPGKPKLAPGSDPRPPLSIDALKEFEDLTKDDDEESDDE